MPDTVTQDAPAAPATPPATTLTGAPATPPPPDESWKQALPEDLRGSSVVTKFKTVADVVKGYVNVESQVGRKGVIVPAKDAPKEQWDQYYTALGRPAAPDKYKLPTEGLPEGVKFDEKLTGRFATKAHELGLTEQQFAGIARAAAEMSGETATAQGEQREQRRQANVATLQKTWGTAFDQNLKLADLAVRKLAGDDLADMIGKSELAGDPKLMDLLAKAGRMIQGDEVYGTGGGTKFTLTPAEAQAKSETWMRDEANRKAYYSADDPGHAAAVKEYTAIMRAAYPS